MRVFVDTNILISAALFPDGPAGESVIHDSQDRPLLRAARSAECDVLITGDRDLLEAGVEPPRALTIAQFMATY